MLVGLLVLAAAAGGFWWMTHRPASAPPAEIKTESAASLPVHNSTVTNDSIIEMVAEKVDPSVIISQIRSSQTNFDMTAPAVIGLSKAGVAANVIEAMRNPQAAVVPPAASSNSGSRNAAQIVVKDGLPIRLTLTADIPATAAEGAALSFKVTDDVRVSGALVIRKGASASGNVVDGAKKKLLGLGKMTFRLDSVDAADGQQLSISAANAFTSEEWNLETERGRREVEGCRVACGNGIYGLRGWRAADRTPLEWFHNCRGALSISGGRLLWKSGAWSERGPNSPISPISPKESHLS